MAGDWLKIELELPDKPEVHHMARILDLDSDAVVGKLFRVWAWFDKHTLNGNASGVTKTLLDRFTSVTGFAQAMVSVGWLHAEGDQLTMPHFDRHTGKSAKKRALTNKRVEKNRNAPNVTKALPEKRREEKNKDLKKTTKKKTATFKKPSREELADYFLQRGMTDTTLPDRFLNHYDSNGWKVGKNPMKDWKAAVRTWEQNRYGTNQQATTKNSARERASSALDKWTKENSSDDGSNVVAIDDRVV